MLKKILRKTIVVGRYIYFKMIGRKLRECRVITFHEISNINKFEEKIIFLKKNYSILPINELLNKRNDNSIAITFDDGYMEWSSEVYDLLDKYQVPALFFINSGLLYLTEDKQRKDYLKKNLNRVKELELLNIEGLKKISKNNLFTIGGHTINHLNLGLRR